MDNNAHAVSPCHGLGTRGFSNLDASFAALSGAAHFIHVYQRTTFAVWQSRCSYCALLLFS
jgi:hypothetical protein